MSTDGNTLTPQNAGYYEGVTDVWYSLISSESRSTGVPTYQASKCMGKSIELQVTPNYRERKVYASNAATRRDQVPESYNVSLNLDQVIPEVRTEVLGRKDGGDGVELITGKNVGPWLAIMFAATLDDGTREIVTLYKGRFSEPTGTHHTKNDGDSYQHPTITGTFVPIRYQNRLRMDMSEAALGDGKNLLMNTASGWASMMVQLLTINPPRGLTLPLTDEAKALLSAGETLWLSYTAGLDYNGEGTTPEPGKISILLQRESGGNVVIDSRKYAAAKEVDISVAVTLPAHSAAPSAITWSATGFADTMFQFRVQGVRLTKAQNAGWSPSADDYMTKPVMPV